MLFLFFPPRERGLKWYYWYGVISLGSSTFFRLLFLVGLFVCEYCPAPARSQSSPQVPACQDGKLAGKAGREKASQTVWKGWSWYSRPRVAIIYRGQRGSTRVAAWDRELCLRDWIQPLVSNTADLAIITLSSPLKSDWRTLESPSSVGREGRYNGMTITLEIEGQKSCESHTSFMVFRCSNTT